MSKTNHGDNLYIIEPKEKSKYFSKYYAMATPITKKIYSIWGTQEYTNKNECIITLKAIKSLIEDRYKTPAEEETTFSFTDYENHIFNLKLYNTTIYLRCNKELF